MKFQDSLQFPSLADALAAYARLTPEKIGARDLDRAMTFRSWYQRSCRLANAFRGLGLEKGDRVCVLAYNCVEWLEIYAATAIAGLVAVPVNFRLVGPEIAFIATNCDARAFIVQHELLDTLEVVREDLPCPPRNFIAFGRGRCPVGYTDYETLMCAASDAPPPVSVGPLAPWTLMYTSGTTGRPKGAIRSHYGSAALSLVTQAEVGLRREDAGLLVMPLCHANSLYFFGTFLYCGATCAVYNRKSFDPEHFLRTLAEGGTTFTSLVPTHYTMMLDLSSTVRSRYDTSAVRKLMISSAPARRETKMAVMEQFRNSGLFEMYGSTETGFVTMLHPEHQMSKLGSVGRECVGSRPIRLLDAHDNEVPDGQPGELYSSNAYTFDGYWDLPQKTRDAFKDGYCSVGDFAFRDDEGFIYLVDRKSNMIISGGENVYPSEVEAILATHPKVKDAAVIGVADEKWGERVHAVIVPATGEAPSSEEILGWCKDRMAGHKRPRSLAFIREDQMPRTATGKVLHRVLRDQHCAGN